MTADSRINYTPVDTCNSTCYASIMQTETQQHTAAEVAEQVKKFVALCQQIVDLSYGTEENRQVLTIDPNGKRYARIITRRVASEGRNGYSVYCFVDLENGDVLKSASWKAPAKGARGNIFAEDQGVGRMTPYGAGYNR